MIQLQTKQNNISTKITNYKNKEIELQNRLDKIEERLIIGKISETKAEELENNIYQQLNQIKIDIDNWTYELEIIENNIDKHTTNNKIPQLTDFNNLTIDEKKIIINETINKIIIMNKPDKYTFEIDIEFNNGIIKQLQYNSKTYKSLGYNLEGENFKL